jgi:hypothetical protein
VRPAPGGGGLAGRAPLSCASIRRRGGRSGTGGGAGGVGEREGGGGGEGKGEDDEWAPRVVVGTKEVDEG